MVTQQLRRTGFDLMSELPWGAHICLFYETAQDLIETNADYFRAALEDGEFCIWALSEPIKRDDALKGLRRNISNFDEYVANGQIELLPGYDWYLKGEEFDPQRITGGWHAKLRQALGKGFAGMRVSGNAFWFETSLWPDFRTYEEELDRSLEGRKMIVLCTYSLKGARAVDLLDAARTHQFSIAIRKGRWEFLESPEMVVAKRKIATLDAAIDILTNPPPSMRHLTPRERTVLAQIIKGATNKEIAQTLSITTRTIEFHRANIMGKMKARNVAGLINKVLRDA
jgi:DNA-binding CsgD family transcriptional regulator